MKMSIEDRFSGIRYVELQCLRFLIMHPYGGFGGNDIERMRGWCNRNTAPTTLFDSSRSRHLVDNYIGSKTLRLDFRALLA